MSLNLAIATSRRRNGWCEFSSPIVEPTAALLIGRIPDQLHRSAVRTKTVGHDDLRLAIALHRTLQKLKRCSTIPAPASEDLKDLALMINRTPKIVRLAVDLHEDLV